MVDENTTQKRQVAVKAKINELIEGKYIKEEGWKPNYIVTNSNKNISRVNLVGVVVSEPSAEMNNQNLIIDDGSGRIEVRSFDGGILLNNFGLGDVILLIGRPREYNDEKYIVPEIIKKIENRKWVSVRKKELEKEETMEKNKAKQPKTQDFIKEEIVESVEEENKELEKETIYEKIIKKIKEIDKGDGVDIEELLGSLSEPNSEKIINSLLEQGEIFEVTPGMVKVL